MNRDRTNDVRWRGGELTLPPVGGVAINVMSPGSFITMVKTDLGQAQLRDFREHVPDGRLGEAAVDKAIVLGYGLARALLATTPQHAENRPVVAALTLVGPPRRGHVVLLSEPSWLHPHQGWWALRPMETGVAGGNVT